MKSGQGAVRINVVGDVLMREDDIVAELLRRGVVEQQQYAQCAKEALAAGKSVVDLLYEKGLVDAQTLESLGWKVQRTKTVISGFEIVGEIKQGAMGNVYKAIQTSLGRLVALKVLPAWLARDATYVERFLREARAAAALNHPNIVSVIDVGVDSGVYYMVMEYVEGENLKDMIARRGRLEEKEALKYTLDIAQALEAAHKAGIVHRDIKPANIIIAEDGTAKLCDLGLAKRQEGDAQLAGARQILGSPQYMAPEQVENSASADIRSDIYSLGVTLFQMLTGRPPYEGRNIYEIMEKQLSEPLPDVRRIVPGVSENVARLIRRMTDKRPERRYQTPTELIKDIKRVMSGRAPRPAAPIPRQRPVSPRVEAHLSDAMRVAEHRVVARPTSSPVGKIVAAAVAVIAVLLLISIVPRLVSSTSPSPIRKQPLVKRSHTPPTPIPPKPPTPPKPPKPSTSSKSGMESRRQNLLPVIEEVLRRHRLNRRNAILALRALASRTRHEEVQRQALKVAEDLCGPLVLDLRQELEAAQKPSDIERLIEEINETAKFVRGTKYEAEVARIKAAALHRLNTSISETETHVRELVEKGKFKAAQEALRKLHGVEQAQTTVKELTALIKRKEAEAEAARRERQRRKQQKLRQEIKAALADLNAQHIYSLLSKPGVLPHEQTDFYLGMAQAAQVIQHAIKSALTRLVGKQVRLQTRKGESLTGILNRVNEKGIIVEGKQYRWSDIPVWQMAKFVLGRKPSARLVAACLSMMCFFREPADKVATLWLQAEKLGVDLPDALKEYLAAAVLSAGLKPVETLMRRGKYISAGEQLSLLVEHFKATRAFANRKEQITTLMEQCLKKSGLKAAFAGEVSFACGMVRVRYDFSDPGQFQDFAFYPQSKKEKREPQCEWRVEDGALYGSGNGCLRWLCPIVGDARVRLIAVPVSETKTFAIRLYDSGRGRRGQFITAVVSLPIYKKQTVGVRNGKPIVEWEYLHDEHRLGYKKISRSKMWISRKPVLKQGKPVIVEVAKNANHVTMKIENISITAEMTGFKKGFVVLRVRNSTVKFKMLTIYCHPETLWVRSRSR